MTRRGPQRKATQKASSDHAKHKGAPRAGNGRSHPSDSVSRAYHVAGHALVAYLMDRPLGALSIVDGEHPHQGGSTSSWESFRPEKCADPAMRDRVERNIMQLFAGDVAEEILTGRPIVRGESADYHQIAELGQCVMETGEVLDAYLHYMALRTRHLLLLPQNWDAVQILAEELLKHQRLERRTALRVINQAMELGLKDLLHHTYQPGPLSGGQSEFS